MRFSAFTFAAIILAPALAAVEIVDVNVFDFGYKPAEITIKVGDEVRWTSTGLLLHNVVQGSNCLSAVSGPLFSSSFLKNGGSFSYKFTAVGEYPYFCLPHCATKSMKGKVTVVAA
ncbi:hypothetical protein BGX26_009510 [Mortierella sp. AD094]|nr:hypothetical protein BGX26_009510 [Mortierella sp. AD094]